MSAREAVIAKLWQRTMLSHLLAGQPGIDAAYAHERWAESRLLRHAMRHPSGNPMWPMPLPDCHPQRAQELRYSGSLMRSR